MRALRFAVLLWALTAVRGNGAGIPEEPVEIGFGPQFFVDDWIVDNRMPVRYKQGGLNRVYHRPVKHPANPLIPDTGSYGSAVWDEEAGLFRMIYQIAVRGDPAAGTTTKYAIAYAESKDGIEWKKPVLGLFEWEGTKENNVVYRGIREARASGPQILLTLPEEEMHGFKYIMSYRVGGAKRENDGIRLIGSNDMIHWDAESDTRIKYLHSDTLNSIVYDARQDLYMMTCRPKDRYRLFQGEVIDTGLSRRVARLSSKELWTEWEGSPQMLLLPDEQDDALGHWNFFYGMPMHYHAGIYWGFLWNFRMNDPIETQLVTSRDGVHWDRPALRPMLIARGEEGAWDDGMVFGGPHWLEVGDEWWFYYGGSDGAHQSKERTTSIGLATLRQEGLVSVHGSVSTGGGGVVTRRLIWPGGDLALNVAAPEGEVKVRVSGERRAPLEGFNYEDCEVFTGDSTAHRVRWKGAEMDSLKGEEIRLEIFLLEADLYTFRAVEK